MQLWLARINFERNGALCHYPNQNLLYIPPLSALLISQRHVTDGGGENDTVHVK